MVHQVLSINYDINLQLLQQVSTEKHSWMHHSTLALNLSELIYNIIHVAVIVSLSTYRLYIFTSALIKTYKDRGRHQQHTHINTDWKEC